MLNMQRQTAGIANMNVMTRARLRRLRVEGHGAPQHTWNTYKEKDSVAE
jgi:hypothetical protein